MTAGNRYLIGMYQDLINATLNVKVMGKTRKKERELMILYYLDRITELKGA